MIPGDIELSCCRSKRWRSWIIVEGRVSLAASPVEQDEDLLCSHRQPSTTVNHRLVSRLHSEAEGRDCKGTSSVPQDPPRPLSANSRAETKCPAKRRGVVRESPTAVASSTPPPDPGTLSA